MDQFPHLRCVSPKTDAAALTCTCLHRQLMSWQAAASVIDAHLEIADQDDKKKQHDSQLQDKHNFICSLMELMKNQHHMMQDYP